MVEGKAQKQDPGARKAVITPAPECSVIASQRQMARLLINHHLLLHTWTPRLLGLHGTLCSVARRSCFTDPNVSGSRIPCLLVCYANGVFRWLRPEEFCVFLLLGARHVHVAGMTLRPISASCLSLTAIFGALLSGDTLVAAALLSI